MRIDIITVLPELLESPFGSFHIEKSPGKKFCWRCWCTRCENGP